MYASKFLFPLASNLNISLRKISCSESSEFMRKILIIAVILFVAYSIFQYLPKSEQTNIYLRIGEKEITAEIARTRAEKERGLSGRDGLAEDRGMIFLYNEEGYYDIWMKDMRFSIDIIWLDSEWKVVDIKRNALPESYPDIFTPIKPAKYILEVNAGFVKENSITINSAAILP